MNYQRFLTPGSQPFDPLALAKETERIVLREGPQGLERKYTDFYSVPVYGGISTGYAAGCCLRCSYCWSNWSRDFPDRLGQFYSPKQVASNLFRAAREGIVYSQHWRERIPEINKLRLSGCEPTLGKEHLLDVLKLAEESKYPLFILETNGILLGQERDYVKKLADFKEKLYVRVSMKAATPEGFTQRTGALGEYYELPFKALKYLLDEGIYAKAAAMTDPKVMPREERELLIHMLDEIDPKSDYPNTLEEEEIDTYDTTIKRLKAFADKEYARKLEQEFISAQIE
jgi:uncharacterized Fe-S cluster-containing radical SAM superfamily protein